MEISNLHLEDLLAAAIVETDGVWTLRTMSVSAGPGTDAPGNLGDRFRNAFGIDGNGNIALRVVAS